MQVSILVTLVKYLTLVNENDYFEPSQQIEHLQKYGLLYTRLLLKGDVGC